MPALIASLGYGISLVPRDLVMRATSAFAIWLTLSFLIGIVVGHCALSEAEKT